ncbi:MAG: hypothetical protein F2786_07080 [Actinobacteria bacterium]|uniref:Unannotated protein n=1 Tax=freshwater metagenome TaxID=449393 RepID=A0A6J7E643_9ZZZZ|nr:hypothetical protein [Actinomycetota bacterium]
MKLKTLSTIVVCLAIFISPLNTHPAVAITQKCPIFDFKQMFIADYTAGSRWDNSSGDLHITWSSRSTSIYDETIARPFSDKENAWIRIAFQSWDDALDTISFQEVDPTASPEIVIGFVPLKPSAIQLNAMGFWNTWVADGIRYKATIKLKASDMKWFSNKNQFIHSVQHELGNALGLGDLNPNSAFTSVLEDPWQPPYGRSHLGDTDTAMIRQMYGESTCTPILTTKP